jgi:ribonuclease P protein component
MSGFPEHQIRIDHEAHLSTVQNASPADPRVPRAHENARRPRCHPCTPRKRAGSPQRLTKPGDCGNTPHVRPGRLTKPAQFEAVLAGGRRSGSGCFLARALPNAESTARLGLIVGKKIAPRSVDRNRVKRLIRIVHRQLAAELSDLDVVVQLRGSPRSRDNATLFKELEELLRGLVSPGSR